MPPETPQNEPMSALTHLLGAGLAVAGLVLLIVSAVMNGTAIHVVTYTIFGATMVILYVMSTVYHYICATNANAKRVFQILDHSAIFVLIAGTYTPVALIALPPGWRWTVFGLIWWLAILGILVKAIQIPIPPIASAGLYLAMGWLILIALGPLRETIAGPAWDWLLIGGTAYTVGLIFFAGERFTPRTRWFGMHEVFHLFVMLGSFAHFWMLFRYLVHVG